jgi:hypothetical protein
VTCLGDVNNDGAKDIGIASPNDSKFYLIFGHKIPYTFSNVNLASMAVGIGVTFTDGTLKVGLGHNSIGDINKDGFDDFAVSGFYLPSLIYIIFGSSTLNSSNTFNLGTVGGSTGFKITASGISNHFGWRIVGGFDINNDTRSDFLVVDPFFSS